MGFAWAAGGTSGSRRGAPPLACVAGGTIANGEAGKA